MLCLQVGIALSQRIEPGIRVEQVVLAKSTPALHIFPQTREPHPIALLAHGNAASKEMLFRLGEALAAAGFDCYSVDQAGFGASPLPVSLTNVEFDLQDAERALGTIDVFMGHSMGGEIGAWTVRKAAIHPKLFVALGDPARLGEHGPPLLLLGGLFEELVRPSRLRTGTAAQVVISPWSDHLLEPYDPVLVNAAVKAACAAVGQPVPATPTAWRLRLAGFVLGMVGAFGLMLYLPELHPRLGRLRAFLVPGILLLALCLTGWPWWGMTTHLRRVPAHLLALAIVWLALLVAARLRVPRWSLPVVTGILALGCIPLMFTLRNFFPFSVLFCALAVTTLCLLPAVAVGRIATLGGSRRDGDIAMTLFASYVIGQFMPLFY